MTKPTFPFQGVLFAFWLLLFSPANCQSNSSSTITQTTHYSQFDLFKNTGLAPCSITSNSTANSTAKSLVPRRGGGHGGGGGSRGGGGGGGSSGSGVAPFVDTVWIEKEADLCKYMTGVPVMIPTTPTQTAFFPWWPTYVAQGLSLLVTYFGLWWTSRALEKHPERQDMKLPVTFWIQLPFDVARVMAWFVKTIHGFANPQRFAWVSVVLWLVPFNYIWLVHLIGSKREYAPANPGYEFDHTNQDWKPIDSTIVKEREMRSSGPQESLRKRKPKLFWTSVAIGFVALLQWIMTLVSVIQHWQYTWSDNPRTQTYVQVPASVDGKGDPLTIDPAMPQACLDWLTAGNLEKSGLIDVNVDEFMLILVATMQLIACTLVLFKGIKELLGFGKAAMGSSYRRTFGMLKLSAGATLVTLGLPALITGMWIVGFVVFGSQDVTLRYTTNLSVTGGCTFGFVNMDKRWGYWDVEYELPSRIVMSLFGAA